MNIDKNRNVSNQSQYTNADLHIWQFAAFQDFLWILFILFCCWFVYTLRSIFIPVLIGWVLAYFFNPIVRMLEGKWKIPRRVSISIVLIFILLLGIIFTAALVPIVIDQTVTLTKKLPAYGESLSSLISEKMPEYSQKLEEYNITLNVETLIEQLRPQLKKIQDNPFAAFETFFSGLFAGTSQAVGFIGNVISSTTYIIISLLLIPIYFFYFSWKFDEMKKSIENYYPVSSGEKIKHIVGRIDNAFSSFFRGRLLIVFILAILFSLGWYLAGVPYWFLLGSLTGFLNIVPYASGIGWPVAILVKYLDTVLSNSQDFSFMGVFFWPSLVFILVQFIDGWLLTPWVQSKAMDLNAVSIIIVVLIGGALGGLLGLLLAIPIAASLKIIANEIVLPYVYNKANPNKNDQYNKQ